MGEVGQTPMGDGVSELDRQRREERTRKSGDRMTGQTKEQIQPDSQAS